MKYLSPREARNLVNTLSGNTIIGVTFIKRTNGKLREMRCRRHVRKGINGGTISEARWSRDRRCRLVTVFDMEKRAFRCINLEKVLSLRIRGMEYTVKQDVDEFPEIS